VRRSVTVTCVCDVSAGFCNQGLNQNSTGACKCTVYGVPYCSVPRAGKSEIEGMRVRQQGERDKGARRLRWKRGQGPGLSMYCMYRRFRGRRKRSRPSIHPELLLPQVCLRVRLGMCIRVCLCALRAEDPFRISCFCAFFC
jgi:hypothetical protein